MGNKKNRHRKHQVKEPVKPVVWFWWQQLLLALAFLGVLGFTCWLALGSQRTVGPVGRDIKATTQLSSQEPRLAVEDFRLSLPDIHHSPIKQIVFSADGHLIASLGSQNDIKIWKVENGSLVGEVTHPRDEHITCIQFAPSDDPETTLFAGLASGKVLLISQQWEVTGVVNVMGGSPIRGLLPLGKSGQIAVFSDNKWKSWSPRAVKTTLAMELFFNIDKFYLTDEVHATGRTTEHTAFGFQSWVADPDGKGFALGVSLFGKYPNPLAKSLKGQDQPIDSGESVLVPLGWQRLGRQVKARPCNPPFLIRSVTLDGKVLAFDQPYELTDYISYPYRVPQRDFPIYPEQVDTSCFSSVLGLAFSPDGKRLASGHDDGFVRVWAANAPEFGADNVLVARRRFTEAVAAVSYSSTGGQLAVCELAPTKLILHVVTGRTNSKPTQIWTSEVDSGANNPRPTASTIGPFLKERKDVHVDKRTGLAYVNVAPNDFSGLIPAALNVSNPAPLPDEVSVDLDEQTGAIPNANRDVEIRWMADGIHVLAWSQRCGRVHFVNIKTKTEECFYGEPVKLALNHQEDMAVTAFAVNPSGTLCAMGNESGGIEVVNQDSLRNPKSFVPERVLDDFDAPLSGLAPDHWVSVGPNRVRTTIGGSDVFDIDPSARWAYALTKDCIFAVTSRGKVIAASLHEPRKTLTFQSPLGVFDPALTPLTGNQLEYILDRNYEVVATPIAGRDHVYTLRKQARCTIWRQASPHALNVIACENVNKLVLAGGATSCAFAMDMSTGVAAKVLDFPLGAICRFEYATTGKILTAWWIEDRSPSGNYQTVLDNGQMLGVFTCIVALDAVTMKPISRWRFPGLCSSLSISQDGSTLAGVWGMQAKLLAVHDSNHVEATLLNAMVQLPLLGDPFSEAPKDWNDIEVLPWPLANVVLSPDGTTASFYDESGFQRQYHRVSRTWTTYKDLLLSDLSLRRWPWRAVRATVSSSGRWIAMPGGDGRIRLTDATSGDSGPLGTHLGLGYPKEFSLDEKRLLTFGDDGIIRVWDTAKRQLVLEVEAFDAGDWVARTPDGRWDGTPTGLGQAHLLSGRLTADLAQTPDNQVFGLVRQALTGRDEPIGDPQTHAARMNGAPTVSVRTPPSTDKSTTDLVVTVTGHGLATTGLNVYVFDRLVRQVRGLHLDAGATPTAIIIHGVPIGAQYNPIKVIAGTELGVNAIISTSSTITVRRINLPLPALYAVCIGVNGKSVTHAESDVQAIAIRLKEQKGHSYSQVRVIPLCGSNATRIKIERTVLGMLKVVQPQDTFIFYFSGHGDLVNNEVFLVPHCGDGNSIDTNSELPMTEIREWMDSCPGFAQWWVFDACHSGTLAKQSAQVSIDGIRRVSGATGCHILAAVHALGAEQAFDDDAKGHGALTGSILTEMDAGRGKTISVDELSHHVAKQVTADGFPEPFIVPSSAPLSLFCPITQKYKRR